jgi:stearoyl-CoA desaturase (delta-9 desaturase)
MLFETRSGQNTIHNWVLDHRIHHKYSDTNADPHSINRGFFFAHVGWLGMEKHPDYREKEKSIYREDIDNDPIVMFQNKYSNQIGCVKSLA